MKKHVAVALCAAMTVCGFRGMAQPSYDPDGTTLKITVPAGETNSIESAKITSEITEIRKLGLGGLIIDADLTGYTGDIRVEAGTWRVIDSKGLGKLSKTALADDVGKVYISDGATLEAKCAEAPKYFGKQIHVSGYGVNRLGALLVSGTANCSGSTWGSNLILEGDTYANSITTAIWYYNTGNSASYITFNGHDFIVCGGLSTNPYVIFSGCNNTDIGRVVCTNGAYLRFQNQVNFRAINGEVGTFVVNDQSNLSGNNMYGRVEWNVIWNTQKYFSPGAHTAADVPVTNMCALHGAVELKRTMGITVANGSSAGLFGPVSGTRGLYIGHGSSATVPTNRFYLASAENTFAGGIHADTVLLDIPVDGAVPQTTGTSPSLWLEDSSVAFSDTTYQLPDAVITNNQECLITEGRGKWTSFSKGGTGTLVYQSRIGADSFEIADGTVRIAIPDSAFRERAGLVEGVDYYTVATDASDAAARSEIATPYAIQLGTRAMYSNHTIDIRRPEGYQENPNQWYNISYSGYIWNRTTGNRNVTFASKVSTTARINIDGVTVLSQGTSTNVILKTVTLTPGPHRIIINNYARVNNGGITFGASNMTWVAKGMMYDPEGRDAEIADYYVKMDDPGDGSLFTWALPGEDATNPIDSTKVGKWQPPFFKTLRFVGGSGALDAAGYALTAGCVEGIPVVQNGGDAFTVDGKWKLDVSDVLAGRKAMGLPLAFGADAELELFNAGAVRGTDSRTGGKWLIAESTQAITGNLTVKDPRLARKWSVSIEDDKVYLTYVPSGVVLIVR